MPFPVSLLNVEFPLPENADLHLNSDEPHEREYAEILKRHSAYVKEATLRDQQCKKEYNEQQVQHRVLSQTPLTPEGKRSNDAFLYEKQMRALYARKKMIEVNSDAGRSISRATEVYKEACRKAELAKAAAAEAAAKAREQEAMEVGEGTAPVAEEVQEIAASSTTTTQTN